MVIVGAQNCSEQINDAINNYTSANNCQPVTEDPVGIVVAQWFGVIVLVMFSALFSGLTLGLLGLDKIGLEIIAEAGSKKDARLANKIRPIRENGNLLLCT